MKVLVTGGAGFIGSNFIRHTLSNYDDIEIVNFDLLTYAGRLENLQDVKDDSRYRFVHGDIRERKTVEPLVKEKFDLIVNFAAETHVDRSVVEAGSFVLTDAYGTYILLDAARKFDVERFVQISTDEVYGSIKGGSFKETDILDPSSPYSASKASGDHIALAFHKTYGLPLVVTRSSNNYGPFQYPEKLIPKLILRALHNQPLPIYGDGRQVRDWLYVTDNCAAIDLVAHEGGAGDVYNIASGEERMNIEVAKGILKIVEKPESLIKPVSDRPGHDRRYSLDTAKIRALGWEPKFGFAEGLEKTVNWYLNNEWWWCPLLKDEFFKADSPWLI
ncbi:MAG: dTDP-glucose 4,6-dehydratase [Candidatus Bathyarchaeota archaeon]|nr:dTDP-glucose 4,6-dehydratase [Candidatus Bathyarchaeota archaeon]MDH5494185.1 dTDP-glucose 4,6-dehydratase [Candidatus Bathyarchaeota archaeon]